MTPLMAPSKPQTTPDSILQLGMAFWGSKTLLSAVGLGLFTELAKGPKDEAALRKTFGLHPRASKDFLDALVALKMLERRDGLYSNTAETDLYLDKAKPTYVGGILEMADVRLYPFWGDLTAALKTGKPQNEVARGQKGLFEELYSDPARLEGFLKAMTGISLGAAHAIAAKFPWKDYKTFLDMGCAQGAVPATLAKAHPHLKGWGGDLAPVEPVFNAYMKQNGVADRVGFKAVDFFKEPLPKADVVVMGHILHDWDLEQKKALAKKAYDALPQGGAYIVYEALIDDERRHGAFGLLMSLNMLIETPGGFDYTGADCVAWMKEAGFRETRVEHLVGPDAMVVGIK